MLAELVIVPLRVLLVVPLSVVLAVVKLMFPWPVICPVNPRPLPSPLLMEYVAPELTCRMPDCVLAPKLPCVALPAMIHLLAVLALALKKT